MTDNFSVFGSVVINLHEALVQYFYLFLPVFFCLALVIDWFKNPLGSPDFLATVKRAVIATLLIVAFQEISDTIMDLANGLADKISDLSGIDSFIKMASQKASTYTMSTTSLILGFNDLVIAILSFVSYIILFIARYVTVAIYHFMWSTLVILSPILILFTLFKGTLSIPINLFRSLAEVASYKIVWAILSAMLTSLAFGNAYAADGNYLTVILLNIIIALAMLGTPLVVKSIIGSGLSSMSETLGAGAVMTMVSVPAKAASMASVGRGVLTDTANYAGTKLNQAQSAFGPKPDFNISKSDIPRDPVNYSSYLPPPPTTQK
jgi:hypothetical protein